MRKFHLTGDSSLFGEWQSLISSAGLGWPLVEKRFFHDRSLSFRRHIVCVRTPDTTGVHLRHHWWQASARRWETVGWSVLVNMIHTSRRRVSDLYSKCLPDSNTFCRLYWQNEGWKENPFACPNSGCLIGRRRDSRAWKSRCIWK